MRRGRKLLKEATLPTQIKKGTTDGNKNKTAETITQNLLKKCPKHAKEYWYSAPWNRKIMEAPSQKELLQSHSESSWQGMEMKNLFYAVVSFHAVLIQYDCSFCAIFWRDFPICRFQMMKKVDSKISGEHQCPNNWFPWSFSHKISSSKLVG